MPESTSDNVRLILIDDDPAFGFLMRQTAKQRQIALDYFPSLLDLGYIGRMKNYDGAIIDYKLESMTGVEIGEYLGAFMRDLPMILISITPRVASKEEPWTANVKTFVGKDQGPNFILDTILAIIGRDKFPNAQQSLSNPPSAEP